MLLEVHHEILTFANYHGRPLWFHYCKYTHEKTYVPWLEQERLPVIRTDSQITFDDLVWNRDFLFWPQAGLNTYFLPIRITPLNTTSLLYCMLNVRIPHKELHSSQFDIFQPECDYHQILYHYEDNNSCNVVNVLLIKREMIWNYINAKCCRVCRDVLLKKVSIIVVLANRDKCFMCRLSPLDLVSLSNIESNVLSATAGRHIRLCLLVSVQTDTEARMKD